MSPIAYRFMELLKTIVVGIPIGTNLGVFYLLWMMCTGRLLNSRGAIFPALAAMGLAPREVRRSEGKLPHGCWAVSTLIDNFRVVVEQEGVWQARRHGGYRPVVCDLTGFHRPRLRNCPAKHFDSLVGKAVPAISVGMIAEIGSVGEQRVPLLREIVRGELPNPVPGVQPIALTEGGLMKRTLQIAASQMSEDETLVVDAGFEVRQLQDAGVLNYVVRGSKNFTARRAYLSKARGRGRRRIKGELVRPLARMHKGKLIPATPPDRTESWHVDLPGCTLHLRAEFWDNLVLPTDKPGARMFHCIVVYDPRYHGCLLLITSHNWSGHDAWDLYHDRWPIEQIPLAAKQMIGAARQFVSAPESCQRTPELSLFAGAVLSYAAAAGPAIATGFWDRQPRATPGRLRRELARADINDLTIVSPQLRKKNSRTDHLPKGIQAHRRHKPEMFERSSQQYLPLAA